MSYSEALEQQVRLARRFAGNTVEVPRDLAQRHWAEGIPEREIERAIGQTLVHAETFYWDEGLCDFLASAAATLPDWSFVRGDLPSSMGFVWFGRALRVPDAGRGHLLLYGLTWNWIVYETDAGRAPGFYAVPVNADGAHGLFVGAYLGRLGEEIEASPQVLIMEGESIARLAGENLDRAVDLRSDMPITNGQTLWMLKLLGAALTFMAQRLVVAPAVPADRHARKRLERDGWTHEPLIRVVQLRRRERIGNPDAVQPTEHEYSCQWVVRGHWRQQWYPKAQRNQPIWITPYVKGPEDKPLKAPRATVFAVVR